MGIFRLPGQASRIHTMKETYDCGSQQDFSPTEDVHTVASLLKLYLRELPEPVIPHVYYESFKDAVRCESCILYTNIHANGLVVICSSSISHNFGLESPIPTIQAFFCSL